MTVRVPGEAEVLREVSQVLVQHLAPAKVARFWASWQAGHSAYLQWRDKLFEEESVATLYEKVLAHQEVLPADAKIR
jgi:hypothetical protein